MNREAWTGIGIIALCLLFVCLMAVLGSEDKYVMRDGCVYHKTKELVGDNFDIEYTLVTCEKSEFHKYEIEED